MSINEKNSLCQPQKDIYSFANITNYTKKVQKASETAAESFTQLMNHVQDYTVINKGRFDIKDFLNYIQEDKYIDSYNYIINSYLDGKLF